MSEPGKRDRIIQIKVVSTEGCGNARPTVELIRNAAADLGVKISLEEVLVATQEEAEALCMFGSPTVQINGLDLDPSFRDSSAYGLA